MGGVITANVPPPPYTATPKSAGMITAATAITATQRPANLPAANCTYPILARSPCLLR